MKHSKNSEIWEKTRTLIPVWIFLAVAECLFLAAGIGTYNATGIIAGVFLLPYVFTGLVGMIPPVNRLLRYAEQKILARIRQFLKKKRKWKKAVLVAATDCLIGLLMERVIALAGQGSFSAEWNFRKWIWLTVIFFLISLFVCYRELLVKRIELILLLMILSIGTVYVTVLPVSCGVSWDDETHFRYSLMLSRIMDGRMTKADEDILNGFESTALEHNLYDQESHEAWVTLLDEDDKSDEWGYCGRLKPTPQNWAYIPSAFGLLLGRALSLPYHVIFILGKWCNLLAYAVLIYFSVRKLKSGKMIAAVVSLLPPCIFMAASYSKDAWMIGFIMLGFCWFIGTLQDKEGKLRIRDMVIMVGALAIGIMPKAVYAPLILICLFVPKNKFQNERQCRIFRLAIVAAVLAAMATFLTPFISSGGGAYEDTRGGTGVDAVAQATYILQNPLRYFKLMIRFLAGYFSLESGRTYLNYLHYFGTAGYPLVTEALLLAVMFTDRGEADARVKWKQKVPMLVMSFLAICLAATSMYIAYTPYMSDTILGCQYRYLLPIMFPSLYVLGSIPLENKMRKDIYRGIVLGVSAFILLNGVWSLCISTF